MLFVWRSCVKIFEHVKVNSTNFNIVTSKHQKDTQEDIMSADDRRNKQSFLRTRQVLMNQFKANSKASIILKGLWGLCAVNRFLVPNKQHMISWIGSEVTCESERYSRSNYTTRKPATCMVPKLVHQSFFLPEGCILNYCFSLVVNHMSFKVDVYVSVL